MISTSYEITSDTDGKSIFLGICYRHTSGGLQSSLSIVCFLGLVIFGLTFFAITFHSGTKVNASFILSINCIFFFDADVSIDRNVQGTW